MSNQPTIYFMVGLPGSSKSTYINEAEYEGGCPCVVSSDQHIEDYAKAQGKTYDEVFLEYIKTASQMFEKDLTSHLEQGISIIIDRTNLIKATRKRYLSKVPDGYKKVAVVTTLHPLESYIRMKKRVGKTLPEDRFIKMMNCFEYPSLEEGFDEIVEIDTNLTKLSVVTESE